MDPTPMKCADCAANLGSSLMAGVRVDLCPRCGSLWVLDREFKELQAAKDRFVRWLEPDLWSDIARHELGRSERKCPVCGRNLHEVRYIDSDIVIDICPRCRGIWLHKGELEKIAAYLKGLIDEKTVSDYLRSMGREASEMLRDRERISEELKNMGMLMKLLEYRIISRFPALSRIASKMPPV